ncbi:MAG: hypothetical protein CMH83_13820 [Nocardioides sp.]|nr:hypothetical protein [Nocardioides sp.]
MLAVPLAACGSENDESGSQERVEALAELPDLNNGQQTEIELDPGFLEALDTLGLTPGVVGDAGLDGATLSFPITGGNVSLFEPGSVPNYVTGQIFHENSGLSLTAGDTVVKLANFNVDPEFSRVYGDVELNGDIVALSAYLFRLNGSTLQPIETDDAGNTVLTGSGVFVSDVAAGLLNDTFGTDAVTDQLQVGVATVTVGTPTDG